jgi:hypothetical protein
MDDTFSFRAAPLPLRRRIDPRRIKLAVVGLLVVASVVAFSTWVIDSERRSEAKVTTPTIDAPLIGHFDGADAEVALEAAALPIVDAPARADARTALATAREAARGRATFADAGPGQLSAIDSSLTFTDGPSPAPGIVSVANVGGRWAAAVMGTSGTCYWIRSGHVGTTFGSSDILCTGLAALSADDTAW